MAMRSVDLRSDTVTQPTQNMREAMFRAKVGDMVHGDDPTVNRLEELAAATIQKEAALLMPSGTMSNLAAALTHCGRGDEIILGDKSHIVWWEVAGPSTLGGLALRTVANDAVGMMSPEEIERVIRPANIHFPRTGLICVENTHNNCGGTVLTVEDMRILHSLAREHGIPVHLDGSRVFNAAIFLGVPAAEIAKHTDSISFCLSKALSAPVGSMLCGSQEFITRARKYRQMLGGGMRQAGVFAAAGIVALEEMVERIAEDHRNARLLAEGLANLDGVLIDLNLVQTNLVYMRLAGGDIEAFRASLSDQGILAFTVPGSRMRFATHYGITRDDIEYTVLVAKSALLSISGKGSCDDGR